MNNESLPYLSSEDRLKAYQLIVDGCQHIWSKNKLNQEKALQVLNVLVPLAKDDPYFLAHLTSWAINNKKHKDLQVLTAFVSSLSSADGTPFSAGSKFTKPNLRYISAAAVHDLDPKLAERVLELAQLKFAIPGHLNEASHFPTALRKALKKYIRFRESNVDGLEKLFRAGYAPTVRRMMRALRMPRDEENAKALRWNLKGQKVQFNDSVYESLKGMSDEEIAHKIQDEKLPFLPTIRALPRKMTPAIAVALLEQATGDQAVICRSTFEDAGVLKDPEVMKLYEQKLSTAKSALDRVDSFAKSASEEVQKVLKQARADQRQGSTAGIGKIYLHLDLSPSMDIVKRFAIEKGAIFAECVNNPSENFGWGIFWDRGEELPLPTEFVQEAFAQVLFGKVGGGGTNAFALYQKAREFGADVDVLVTDRGHNVGILSDHIAKYHRDHPEHPKPKACVIVDFKNKVNMDWGTSQDVKDGYEIAGIPVALMDPDTLSGSSLVSEAVRNALLGPVAIIDEIMETELLKLPEYYFTVKSK